ncbi:MAG: RnfABCDGE type electron transport complex subunit G [Phocaeicola sp.]|uniref:RnfABCDGE type electron transport complex subunit G n=1 Tax=Phocaeicola TaxID=909656 RepID=UPI00234F6DAB|nr:RnfABCDGE type electron transport complex subunit G [Phocaeicola oris]MCE2616483.1 RnfABCDGE type electron transport complex subunit G [Phocaeicola oris]
MKKLESSLINMILSLTLIAAIVTAMLAYVNQLTKGPIAEANQKALNEALKQVLPEGAIAAEPQKFEVDGAKYTVYPAIKGEEKVGAAIETAANGFGGELRVLVGFDKEGNILNYSIMETSETPGLGSKADTWFKKDGKGSIIGMNPGEKELTVSKDGGNVDAITASTITSRAFLKAVNNAYAIFSNKNDGISGATNQAELPKVQTIN